MKSLYNRPQKFLRLVFYKIPHILCVQDDNIRSLFVLYLFNLSPATDPLHMTSYWASGGQIYIFINFQKSVNFDKMLKY